MPRRSLDLDFDLATFRTEDFTRDQLVEMCLSRSISCPKRELKVKLGERLRDWHRQTYNDDGSKKSSPATIHDVWGDLVDDASTPSCVLPATAWGLHGVQNGRTRDLVPMTAQEAPVDSVLFFQHAGSEYFHLYSVVRVSSTGPFVRLISSIPNVAAPCPETSITGGWQVNVLSLPSREYITKFNAAKNLMSIEWPSAFVAAAPPDARVSWLDVSPVQGPVSRGEQLVGAPAPPKVLFVEEGRTSASRAKTPRGQNLTEAQALVLSADPETVLNTGNINAFMILHYLGAPSRASTAEEDKESLGSFWGLDRWVTQVQPVHLLWMVNSLVSVDVRLWASLWDTYTTPAIEQLVFPFLASDDKLVPTSPDWSVVSGYCQRLRLCLLNFCVTVDVLFRLRPVIRQSLRAAVERTMRFIASVDPGPANPATPLLLHYVAYRFQQAVGLAYGHVRGCVSTSPEAVADEIALFPNREQHSTFSIDVDMILMHQRLPPSMLSLPGLAGSCRESLFATPPPMHHASGAAPSPAPAPAADTTPPKPGPKTFPVCGYWNSTRGCRKSTGCSPHRAAKTAEERLYLDEFFAQPRNKKLARKP